MGLKILHSADWHLDSPFGSLQREQREKLRHAQKALPGKIAEICHQESCDLVLLAGDLFDKPDPGRETVEAVKAALKECAVPVFISPGNHDFCCPGSPWLEETWPENVHVFTGGLESVALPELDCRIYGAGYRSMDCPPLLEKFQAEGQETYQIGLFHGDPMALRSPCCPITNAQVRDSGLNYLALGHIHKAGSFRAGETLCAWPGCPMGRGWDETGEKGIYLACLEENIRVRQILLDTPRFFPVETDIGEDGTSALAAVLPAAGNENFYRVTLTGRGKVNTAELMAQFSSFPNLELVDKTMDPAELWEDAGTDTLRGVYFGLLQQAAEEDPRARLAAEISRQLLEGREVALL